MAHTKHRRRRFAAHFVLGLALIVAVAAAGVVASWAAVAHFDQHRKAAPLAAGAPAQEPDARHAPDESELGAPPEPRGFTLVATGDILIHTDLWERAAATAHEGEAYSFRPMFSKVRPAISAADLAICHLETPLSAEDQDLSSFPVFNIPHELADAIAWAGYDECSTASNHSVDQGSAGVKATLDALDEVGVSHAGTARNKQEAHRITFLRANGVKVAHLSYSYGFNGFQPSNPWEANQIDAERILADAERARKVGSEFTIVSLHWGTEYVTAPTPYQEKVAKRLAKSDSVDLIIGHHAHVIQPVARVGGKYVAFGLGNFLSGMLPTQTASVEDGIILQVRVEEGPRGFMVQSASYTPTWVEPGTWQIVPVAQSLDQKRVSEEERQQLEASWNRTVAAVSSLGVDTVRPKRAPEGV